MKEDLRNQTLNLSAEELIALVRHDTNAPIHACLGLLKLFNEVIYNANLTEEQFQLLDSLQKHLNNIKLSHEMMSEWLDNQKEDLN
jgi:hypothetical protein